MYEDPSCAYCPPKLRACRKGELERGSPGFCPSNVNPDAQARARAQYDDPEIRRFAHTAAAMEAEGYCKWSRLEEIIQFAKRMGYEKLGIANCIAFNDYAHTLSAILESHGFEVISVACKNASVPKEEIGLAENEKVHPGEFEAMCNPIAQAELLNDHGSEFNILLGLCVGHDSLFFRYSKAFVTVLVAKDRVLAHNPLGALELAGSYYSRVWGPHKPEKPATLPASSRRKT
jgi:uncharacterized metal-binding protein